MNSPVKNLNNLRKRKIPNTGRYKTSLTKVKKPIISASKNEYSDSSTKFEQALINLKEGLEQLSNEFPLEETSNNYNYSYKNVPLKRISYSAPKNRSEKNTYLRNTFNIIPNKKNSIPKNINSKKYININNSYLNSKDNFSMINHPQRKLVGRYSNYFYNDRSNYKADYTSDVINLNNNYFYNSDISKNNEIALIIKILKKQNKQYKIKNSEMRNKINDLLNNLSMERMSNQRLNNEKKKLLMKITSLENELEIKNSMKLNEIELKNSEIEKLKDEIMNLKILLDKKEKQIINLENNYNNLNNNNLNNYKYSNNNGYDNSNQFLKNIPKSDIHLLDDNFDELNNNMINNNPYINNSNIDANSNLNNNYLNQINELKNQLKEYEKLKNNFIEMKNQKNSYEMKQLEYQNNIDILSQQLNLLKEDNNNLKITNHNQNKRIISDKNTIKKFLDENNNLKNKIKNIEEQIKKNNAINKMNNPKNNINENNNINEQEINYLKSDLEEKIIEINELNEKIKNLMNQLNISKNGSTDLEKNNQKLKEEIEQLNVKISSLENENLNNQQQIFELSNLNNKLQIRVNSVHSGNFKLNTFGRKDNSQDLEQQLQLLQQKNEELQEQIMYLNKDNNNNINIAKLIEEKQNLSKENLDLKNELLILKNQINENENENDNSYNINDNNINLNNLNNINNNNGLETNKIEDMEKLLEEMKKKNELNLDLLEKKEAENQNLISKLKSKENEMSEIQKQYSNSNTINDYKKISSSNILNIAELTEEIEELKKVILEKNKQLEQLEDEINNIKKINNKLLQENNELKKQSNKNEEDNAKDEELYIQIENLKEELKDKEMQIENLIKENNNLKNNKKKDTQLIDSNDDEKEINNNKDENILLGRPSLINDKLSDAEKVKIFIKQLKELKLVNESDMIQIRTLKADIKELKEKVKKMETFSGQLKNFNEFVALLNRALMDYTPKKKEQREAFNKLVDVINNHHI